MEKNTKNQDIGFVMLNLSLDYVIVGFKEVEVLNVDVLDVKRSIICLNLPLAINTC